MLELEKATLVVRVGSIPLTATTALNQIVSPPWIGVPLKLEAFTTDAHEAARAGAGSASRAAPAQSKPRTARTRRRSHGDAWTCRSLRRQTGILCGDMGILHATEAPTAKDRSAVSLAPDVPTIAAFLGLVKAGGGGPPRLDLPGGLAR